MQNIKAFTLSTRVVRAPLAFETVPKQTPVIDVTTTVLVTIHNEGIDLISNVGLPAQIESTVRGKSIIIVI